MTSCEGRRCKRGSVVWFTHEWAKHNPTDRPGVVVRVRGGYVEIAPGLAKEPDHSDFVTIKIPESFVRFRLPETTHFDLRDIGRIEESRVDPIGVLPRKRSREIRRRMAEMGERSKL